MEVRLAKQSDAAPIIAFDPEAHARRSRVNFIYRSITARNAYVATLGDTVLGYGVLEYSFFHHGFISVLFVPSEHRRQGIGAALVQYIEAACDTEKLFTSTNRSNKIMQALLKKLDFSPSGVIENLDDEDAELIYFKRLHPLRSAAGARSGASRFAAASHD